MDCSNHPMGNRKKALRRLIDQEYGGVIARMAKAVDIDASYLTRCMWPKEKKGYKEIGVEVIDKIALKHPNWDSDIKNVPISRTLANKNNDDDVLIPQFEAAGGMGNGLVLRDQSGIIESWKVSRDWVSKNVKAHSGVGNLCIVTGFGDSMRPMFNSGDPLLVDIGVKTVEFDAIYFFRVGTEGFIKRLQRIPGDGVRAISENKSYDSWTIKPDMEFEVFGRVLKVWCSEDF
jgi:hypothetical protein